MRSQEYMTSSLPDQQPITTQSLNGNSAEKKLSTPVTALLLHSPRPIITNLPRTRSDSTAINRNRRTRYKTRHIRRQKQITAAHSSAVPFRPSGVGCSPSINAPESSANPASPGVGIMSGATQLTRIPLEPNSTANDCVNC